MTSKILWSVSVRAICKQGLVQSRARGVLVPETETSSREIRASASHSNPVAILPTSGGGPLRTALERTRTPIARAVRIFVLGPRTILNLCRRLKVSGNPSFLRIPFVDHCSEATNSITNWLIFSPVQLSPCALNHAHKKAWRRTHGVQRNSATGASNE